MTKAPGGTYSPNDSRKHPRFSIDVDATIKRKGIDDFKARTRDLSLTGICLIAAEPLVVGRTETISLVLAFGQGAYSEPLTLPTRVVWCTRIGSSYQIGAMFEDVSDEQDSYLDMFLQFLDGTLSPRGADVGDVEDEPRAPSPDELDNPFRR
ncbi:MAG: PilZ domain-containing protein [Deltaproteobacteria bacterium]|nr:PilZ domain-containing protein [Deltaproteobacteria bacterium]